MSEIVAGILKTIRSPLAAGTAVVGLALASAGCGNETNPAERFIDDAEAAAMIEEVPIDQTSDANGIVVSHYNTVPRLPSYSLWGVVQYCTKKGGEFVQITITQGANLGDPADVTNATRGEFKKHDDICINGSVSEAEVRAIAIPIPQASLGASI